MEKGYIFAIEIKHKKFFDNMATTHINNADERSAMIKDTIWRLHHLIGDIEEENGVDYFDNIQDEDVREIANYISSAIMELNEALTRLEMEAKR